MIWRCYDEKGHGLCGLQGPGSIIWHSKYIFILFFECLHQDRAAAWVVTCTKALADQVVREAKPLSRHAPAQAGSWELDENWQGRSRSTPVPVPAVSRQVRFAMSGGRMRMHMWEAGTFFMHAQAMMPRRACVLKRACVVVGTPMATCNPSAQRRRSACWWQQMLQCFVGETSLQ